MNVCAEICAKTLICVQKSVQEWLSNVLAIGKCFIMSI